MTRERITGIQTVDMSSATPEVLDFMLAGYPGFASQLNNPRGPLVREYEPGSASEGPISVELLPMQIEYMKKQRVSVESDPTGHSFAIKPLFVAVATAQDIPAVAEPVLDPFVPSPVVDHQQPVLNA